MARKILPLCVAVVMLAGVAQAVEYIPPTFTTSTATWGDITIVGASLDSVGTDYTPAEYVNTVAADGATDWAADYDGNTGPQYRPSLYFNTVEQEPNGLDPLPFALDAYDGTEPELITTVSVPEGWYRVFVAYTGSMFARLSDDREFTPYNGNDPINGVVTDAGTVVVDDWGNENELIDHTVDRTNSWTALIAPVGYAQGPELTLRTGFLNRIGNRPYSKSYIRTALYGIGYQAVTDVIVVDESDGQTVVTEGGATDTITVTLTDQPTADVTITLTPDSAAYALDAEAAGDPVELVFTSADWAAKTVTVNAADDDDGDNHSGSIAISVSSDDAGYGSDVVGPVAVTVLDDDVPAAIPGLIGWWKLDGNGQDSSGYGNHLTMVDEPEPNHPEWSFDRGMDGLAVHTNHDGGPWGEVSPADPNFYIPTEGLSVSYWFRMSPYNTGGWGWFVSVGDYGEWSKTCWLFRMWGTSTAAFTCLAEDGDERGSFWGDNILQDNQWHHVVGTWDKATGLLRKYHDGVQAPEFHPHDQFAVAGVNLKPNVTGTPLRLLYSNLPNYPTRNVWLDDVRIYDHTLTAYEVGALTYEITGEFVCTGIEPEDLNGDCEVNMQDFALMAAKWLNCNKIPHAACGN